MISRTAADHRDQHAGQPAGGHLVREPDQLGLAALPEQRPVERDRRDDHRGGGGRGEQRDDVDVALERRGLLGNRC